MVASILAVALALALGGVGAAAASDRRRARRFAEAVRLDIEPYLRRKAAEAGVVAAPPVWTSRTPPGEIVAWSCNLARRLNDRERGAATPGDSLELGATRPIL